MRRTRVIIIRRKAIALFVVCIACVVALSAWAWPGFIPVIGERLAKAEPWVVIDPGHGGVDPGANWGKQTEKDLTLDIALRTREYLVRQGISVALTRETDTDLSGLGKWMKGRHAKDLAQRSKLLNQGKAAVSIHVNASGDESVKGALVLYSKGSQEGKLLAESILKEVGGVQSLNHTFAIPRSKLYVLNNTDCPAAMIEVGFLTNPEDRSNFSNPDFREKLARAIALGIFKYFSRTE